MENFISAKEINEVLSLLAKTSLSSDCFFADKNMKETVITPLISKGYYDAGEDGESYFCDYATGTTRFVLFPRNKDFVIKIPFKGQMYRYRMKEEDEAEKIECSSFEGAYYNTGEEYTGWDYCDAEEMIYRLAENNRVGQYFLATIRIGEVNGYPIYAQPLAQVSLFHDRVGAVSQEIQQSTSQVIDAHEDVLGEEYLPVEWAEDFVNVFGEDELDGLLNFLEDMGIADLHDENVGYTGGKPILFDYVGFND